MTENAIQETKGWVEDQLSNEPQAKRQKLDDPHTDVRGSTQESLQSDKEMIQKVHYFYTIFDLEFKKHVSNSFGSI